jgi:hypothetical protein
MEHSLTERRFNPTRFLGYFDNPCANPHTAISCHFDLQMDKEIVEAVAGQIVRIICRLCGESDPLTSILWFQQHRRVECSSRIRMSRPSPRIACLEIFDSRTLHDSGKLECVAFGRHGVCSATTQLIIHEEDIAGEEPHFSEPLTAIPPQAAEGAASLLECRVEGFPAPHVTFLHNKRVIQEDANYQISTSLSYGSSHPINPPHFQTFSICG